jgi:transcription elongation factor GreA
MQTSPPPRSGADRRTRTYPFLDLHRSSIHTRRSDTDMTQDAGTIWLTQDAFDKLQAELEDLKGPRRQDIIEKIAAARDEGDLKENSGYHAAKDEQGKQEARIRQLEDMLRRAEVGETPPNDGVVEPGMVVTVKLIDFDEEEKFLLGARENLAEGDKLDVYSPQSAMGAAINGKSKGETVTYSAPNGKDVTVEILDAEPYRA